MATTSALSATLVRFFRNLSRAWPNSLVMLRVRADVACGLVAATVAMRFYLTTRAFVVVSCAGVVLVPWAAAWFKRMSERMSERMSAPAGGAQVLAAAAEPRTRMVQRRGHSGLAGWWLAGAVGIASRLPVAPPHVAAQVVTAVGVVQRRAPCLNMTTEVASASEFPVGTPAYPDRDVFPALSSLAFLPAPRYQLEVDTPGRRIRLRCSALPDAAVEVGAAVAFTAEIWPARGLRNPGVPATHWQFAASGVTHEGRLLQVAVQAKGGSVATWAARYAETLARRLQDAAPESAARALLAGVAFGDRTSLSVAQQQSWRVAGVFHALSVSGLHLALVALVSFALLRRIFALGVGRGWVNPARVAIWPTVGISVAYTLVTGGQIATWRACVAVGVWAGAIWLRRAVDVRSAWGLTGLLLLGWTPAVLFDVGFQLSMAATYTLILLSPAHTTPNRRTGIRRWVWRTMRASFWITVVTAPVLAYHFEEVAPGGVFGNLLVLPLVEFAALPLALLWAVIGPVAPSLAAISLQLALVAAEAANTCVAQLARALPLWQLSWPNGATAAVAMLLLLGCARCGWRDQRTWAALLVVGVLHGASFEPPALGMLRVTFFDVGQGDAALIETPTGQVWLVDAGGWPGRRSDVGAKLWPREPGHTLARVLRARGIARIDDAWISHPHPDHYLGFAQLAWEIPIDTLWLPSGFRAAPPLDRPRVDDREFAAMVQTLVAAGTVVRAPPLGDVYRLGTAPWALRLAVKAPAPPAGQAILPSSFAMGSGADPIRTLNDNSVVLHLGYAGRTFAFLGDSEREAEELVAPALGGVDVLKVAHHGSATSSTPALIRATQPQHAVISCGLGNRFGFPRAQPLQQFTARNAYVWRTDLQGAITFVVAPNGNLHVTTEERQR